MNIFKPRFEPTFWKEKNIKSIALLPASFLYVLGVLLYNFLARSLKVKVPVICIGNVTVGGTGKTTVAIELAKAFSAAGKKVAILTRGYGKKHFLYNKVIHVTSTHTAEEVGDEALLLARHAEVYVCPNRENAVRIAVADGADIILLDDALQNLDVWKDYLLTLIDGHRKFGNGFLLPAGPMREPLWLALNKSHAVLFIDSPKDDIPIRANYPRFFGTTVVTNPEEVKGEKFIAVASIANPERFFMSAEKNGAILEEKIIFPDHYLFTKEDLDHIYEKSKEKKVMILMTEKDFVKVPEEYKDRIKTLNIKIELPKALIEKLFRIPEEDD